MNMIFDDSRKFDDWSFVGLLVRNKVPHRFTDGLLSFPTKVAEQRACSIWKCLTNSDKIG